MQFQITRTGPVSDCRDALSAAVADRGDRTDQEHTIVREIQYLLATTILDPADANWRARNAALNGAGLTPEPAPTITISATCTVG